MNRPGGAAGGAGPSPAGPSAPSDGKAAPDDGGRGTMAPPGAAALCPTENAESEVEEIMPRSITANA